MMETSTVEEQPPQHKVLIHFHEADFGLDYITHLYNDFKSKNINVSITVDENEGRSLPLDVVLQKIEESKIVFVIFSENYTDPIRCSRELDKIKDRWVKRTLAVVPIYYKMNQSTVRSCPFSDAISFTVDNISIERYQIDLIVYLVKENLNTIGLLKELKDLNDIYAAAISGLSQFSKEKEEIQEIKQSLKICYLLILLYCLQLAYMNTPFQQIAYMSTPLNYERTEKTKDKETNLCNSYERTEKVKDRDIKSYNSEVKPLNIQVFINFRGEQLRRNFISYLVDALQRSEVNVFIYKKERIGEDLNKLFKRIEDSGIAIVVFSSRYAESNWCLEELVKIRERALKGLLKVLPIYYKVNISNVKRLKGDFGDHFRDMELMYQV